MDRIGDRSVNRRRPCLERDNNRVARRYREVHRRGADSLDGAHTFPGQHVCRIGRPSEVIRDAPEGSDAKLDAYQGCEWPTASSIGPAAAVRELVEKLG
jgi:hypothetical protein